jgi:hypothetical protein
MLDAAINAPLFSGNLHISRFFHVQDSDGPAVRRYQPVPV